MNFVIYCTDDPATPNAREDHYAQHRAHLASATVKLLVAGPYTEATSERKIGSMLLVEAENLEQVRAFAERDPFYVNRVWNDVRIHPFVKSTDNR